MPLPRKQKLFLGLFVGVSFLFVAIVASLAVGSKAIAADVLLEALLEYNPLLDDHVIVWELRVPRTIVAALAGISLGAAGSIMQAITRNPLAEPGLLGVNAGAAIAVIIGVSFFKLTAPSQYVWFGMAGAGLSGAAVFVLGGAGRTGTNPVRLVLAGAAISIMLGSLTGVIIINSPLQVLEEFRTWAAGSVEGKTYASAFVLLIATALGCGIALSIALALNAVSLGEDLGTALGANATRTQVLACVCVMLLAGSATAAAGPIGFIGLVAPHMARQVTGPDCRWLLPYASLFAAALLLSADVLGRIINPPSEVAVGIVASLIGGPLFLVIVRRFKLRQL